MLRQGFTINLDTEEARQTMNDEERVRKLQETLSKTEGKPPTERMKAMQYLMVEPDQATADVIWKWLVIGLVAALGMALAGLVVLIALGKPSDTLLTAFTALLSGLIGLFVKSPATTNGGAS